MIDFNDRASVMAGMYGEVCKKGMAAKLLNVSPGKIADMLADGRLDSACEGKMVDVRSIARYISAPAKEDFDARQRRRREKTGCRFAV